MAVWVVRSTVLVTVAAWLWARAQEVGWLDAAAELLGVARLEAYSRWREAYWPLHAELALGVLREEWLDAALVEALSLDNATQRADALRALSTREGASAFSLRLFRPDFCRKLVEEVAYFEASGRWSPLPNSMNEHGLVVKELGMDGLMAELRQRVLSPLADALYSVEAGEREDAEEAAAAVGCCSEHHAFTVRYDPEGQQSLDMHHDDSDVTLNVCLEASGAASSPDSGLAFCGFPGSRDHRQHRFTFHHQVGRAVVHLGRQRHGVEEAPSGSRQNLIMWGRRARSRGGAMQGAVPLHADDVAPDTRCLSWTHDADFERHRPLPAAALKKRQEREEAEKLMKLVRAATEDQISRLPLDHQPVVRLLRALDESYE